MYLVYSWTPSTPGFYTVLSFKVSLSIFQIKPKKKKHRHLFSNTHFIFVICFIQQFSKTHLLQNNSNVAIYVHVSNPYLYTKGFVFRIFIISENHIPINPHISTQFPYQFLYNQTFLLTVVDN